MTLKSNAMLRRGIALLLGESKPKEWHDVVALRFLMTEAKAVMKKAEEMISPPPAHAGPYSGHKPSEKAKARNGAAAALRPLLDQVQLLCKSLPSMSVAELQKTAASAMEAAFFADALLEKIGPSADPAALVTDLLSARTIEKIMTKMLGKKAAEYRVLASPAH